MRCCTYLFSFSFFFVCLLFHSVTKFFDRSNRIANEVRTDLNWIINYYPFYCVLDGSLYDAIGVYLLFLSILDGNGKIGKIGKMATTKI